MRVGRLLRPGAPVAISFEVENTCAELVLSHETTDLGWWKAAGMEAMENHGSRIHDAVKNRPEVVFQ